MSVKDRREVEEFVAVQKDQLGLNDDEAQALLDQSMEEAAFDIEEDVEDFIEYERAEPVMAAAQPPPLFKPGAVSPGGPPPERRKRTKAGRKDMADPYLPQSQTIKARPTKVSKTRSFFFEFALPNEYIVQVGVKDAKPVLGGKFFKLGKRFLKFPAAVQTVYFTSDNANKNYQGLRIDGYACWRVDPESSDMAARTLDFSDQENPMGNTNRILRTICTEAIRHIIANIGIEEALTKKDEIGRDLKAQLERIERSWGVIFDQVGIERVTILSSSVFDDLQQKTRDNLRLAASESRMSTDREIEKKKAEYTEEMEQMHSKTEKETRIRRASTESEIHKVELAERAKREAEERKAAEESAREEMESAERADEQKAEQTKRQAIRDAEIKSASVEADAKAAEARSESEALMAAAEHRKQLKVKELEAAREAASLKAEMDLETERQAAELELSARRFERKMEKKKEKALVEHELEVKRLERIRVEEEVRNLLSDNRVLAALVKNLPAIVSSMKIDRYTVVDGGGGSPLSSTIAQVLSIFDEQGLGKFLGDKLEKAETVEVKADEDDSDTILEE